jgi:hypothetical protein
MKVLFIARRKHESLMIEREITLLQQRGLAAAGEDVTFHFLPDISVESLPLELSRHRPDVLHISAHASKAGIEFSNSSGDLIVLSADNLLSLLDPEHPPRLIYLNDCESDDAAKQMVERSLMAIGSTAPITNRAAMAAAVLFYDRLISGFSVQQAFDAAQAIIRAIHAESASAELYFRPGVIPRQEWLHHVPRLVAELKHSPSKKGKDFEFEFGLLGCRHDTVQVVFFTDDEDFIRDDPDSIELDLCLVVRGKPTRGMIWSHFDWESPGDCVFHACATTSGGLSYSVSSTVCDAIESKLLFIDNLRVDDFPEVATSALARLREEDGTRMAGKDEPKKKRKKGKKTS